MRLFFYALALLTALTGVSVPANAGVAPPFQCIANAGVPPVVRDEGYTELVGDVTLSCTGGTPTPAGEAVPQVNFEIFLNTLVTSRLLSSFPSGPQFNEALLIIDEPNSPVNPTRPILNCGAPGAPDGGATAPGICPITSDGDPTHTYNGSAGHPNVFQGQQGTGGGGSVLSNSVAFLSLPLDPPGMTATRTIRITNVRANAAAIGVSPTFTASQIQMSISVTGSTSLSIAGPVQTVGFVQTGLLVDSCGTPAASTVRFCEGFASSWKTKNISFYTGDNGSPPKVGNANNSGTSSFTWSFNGDANYPDDVAQNVPGAIYPAFTESSFEWLNNTTPGNGPPPTNPPPGLGFPPGSVTNNGNPFSSSSGTGIMNAGWADSGTRLTARFRNVPAGDVVQVPLAVDLYDRFCTGSCAATGLLVLTTGTDSAGGGTFTRAITMALGPSNMAVYEVLMANPFILEYADVPYTVTGATPGASVNVTASFAPFYTDSSAGMASATGFVPRFADSSQTAIQTAVNLINGFGLPGGTATSLIAKLNAALAAIKSGDPATACTKLADLINEAKAQSGKKLTVAQANQIIAQAIAIRNLLGC